MNDEVPLSNWRSSLSWLVPGDLVHGRCSQGHSLLCLVESLGPDRIVTRRITTQEPVTFDIETGEVMGAPGGCLDSIMPLPVDLHDVLLGLDRKMRLGDQPLSPVEKDALDLANEVYAAHPLGTTGRRRRDSSAVA